MALKGTRVVNRRVFYEGDKIFKEGDDGREAYLTENGKVEIVLKADTDDEKVVGLIGPGEIFGEMALVDAGQRMATARVVEQTSVIVIDKRMFLEKLEKTDPFIRSLLKIFVEHIRRLQK